MGYAQWIKADCAEFERNAIDFGYGQAAMIVHCLCRKPNFIIEVIRNSPLGIPRYCRAVRPGHFVPY